VQIPDRFQGPPYTALIVIFIMLGIAGLGLMCCPHIDTWARVTCGALSGLFLVSVLVVVVGDQAVQRAFKLVREFIRLHHRKRPDRQRQASSGEPNSSSTGRARVQPPRGRAAKLLRPLARGKRTKRRRGRCRR
jgi:hypothetical protein